MTVIWEDLTFEDLQRVMWAILPKAAQIWKDHKREFYQIIIVKLRIFTYRLRSGKGRELFAHFISDTVVNFYTNSLDHFSRSHHGQLLRSQQALKRISVTL
jgi:hypothetical protein